MIPITSRRCISSNLSCSSCARSASALAVASASSSLLLVSALKAFSSVASSAASSSTNNAALKLNNSFPDNTDKPFPPFFFVSSIFTLASASACRFANFAALHLAKLSAVTGVPTFPSDASFARCSSIISSIVFSLNTSTATGSSSSKYITPSLGSSSSDSESLENCSNNAATSLLCSAIPNFSATFDALFFFLPNCPLIPSLNNILNSSSCNCFANFASFFTSFAFSLSA